MKMGNMTTELRADLLVALQEMTEEAQVDRAQFGDSTLLRREVSPSFERSLLRFFALRRSSIRRFLD